ncbi:MAG: acyl-CoA dehydrogenase [Gemmatimonadota bacterium]
MNSRATDTPRRDRDLHRELLPLAPFLYLVWSDGALSAEELSALRERAARPGPLSERSRAALRAWLNPDDPPAPAELARLLELVHAYGSAAGPDVTEDLVQLGERIARSAHGPPDAAVHAVLAELQEALGVANAEAARSLVGGAGAVVAEHRYEDLDPAALYEFLERDGLDVRRRVLAVLQRDSFRYIDPRDTRAYREQVLRWCVELADEGFGALAFPAEFGGADDLIGSIAAFETIAFHDLSLLVKYGVHFGLFGGSIYLLGTRRHHEKYLAAVGSLELPGCFAMTETGHGSNVRDIETTATYHTVSGEFVIDTPHDGARKDYIGNAALHGRMAVVFAQLVTDAGRHGVHAFVVPIRHEDGAAMPGVGLEDCGLKGGLNGVDNGRIRFDGVRIPRDNLLDRYGSVSDGGAYSSPIASAGRRFFTMLGTLVAGRISIAGASVSAGKSGLTIALRYTDRRVQFGPEGGAEVPVLDYTSMQRRLLPRLAAAYALDFALKSMIGAFAAQRPDDAQEIETLAAALKAYASDWAVATLQACRESCGGQGYMAVNRITTLRADTDIFTTFEGANHVLYQLVAKGRLTDYREQFGELKMWNIVRHIGARAATRVAELNPIIRRRTDQEHLLDPEFHATALRYREDRLLASLARRLKHRLDQGMDSFDALNECQDHAVELGRAFAERYVLDAFHRGLDVCPEPGLRSALEPLAALYALDRLRARSAWLLEAGYIEPVKARAIRNQVNELCRQIRPRVRFFTDAFGIPEPLLDAPIARSA